MYVRVVCHIIETDVHPGFGQILFHLRNCSFETFPFLIRVKCAYPGDSGRVVTGFQVIAQPADFDRFGKLYAGHSMQCQTSAIVEVEQNGEFLLSVIPVLGETGIANSSVEYSEVVVAEDFVTATGIILAKINCIGHHCPISVSNLFMNLFMTFICIGTTAVNLDTEFVKDVFFGNSLQ